LVTLFGIFDNTFPLRTKGDVISTRTVGTQKNFVRPILAFFCLLAALLLFAAMLAPTSFWQHISGGTLPWTDFDNRDLKYLRQELAGLGFIGLLWSFVLAWNFTIKPRLPEQSGNRLYRGVILTLILSMAYFGAKLFIIFRDSVRIVGEKTPFSNWGEYLGSIWTVPIQPFTERDYFNSMFLAFAGFVCALMVLLRHKGLVRRSARDFPRMLWAVLAFGFVWASVDELVMIHEFLGPNLAPVRALHAWLGITKYPDDLIMLGYFAAGGLVLVRYIRYFLHRKSAFGIFLLAITFQGLAAVNGVPGLNLNEESFEMYGGLCYFVSMFWYAYCEIEESLDFYHRLPGADA
jgi:hypothetical protein